jgi:hypothetical protein
LLVIAGAGAGSGKTKTLGVCVLHLSISLPHSDCQPALERPHWSRQMEKPNDSRQS